jgi:hypothetical protein
VTEATRGGPEAREGRGDREGVEMRTIGEDEGAPLPVGASEAAKNLALGGQRR